MLAFVPGVVLSDERKYLRSRRRTAGADERHTVGLVIAHGMLVDIAIPLLQRPRRKAQAFMVRHSLILRARVERPGHVLLGGPRPSLPLLASVPGGLALSGDENGGRSGGRP